MSKLDFEQRQRLENDVLPAVIDDPEHAAATIVRLEAEIETLREALKQAKDLAEFFINREDIRNYSEEEFRIWLALGHQSNAMKAIRAALTGEDKA